MAELTEAMAEKLNDIGIALGELQRMSKILQACLDYHDDFKTEDLNTILNILKLKICEIKKDFNNIEAELKI